MRQTAKDPDAAYGGYPLNTKVNHLVAYTFILEDKLNQMQRNMMLLVIGMCVLGFLLLSGVK